ncbi:OmpA family protein [Marinobacter hydrocarbonoclasticus]|nr:OmpA family protein [Marinobacter nauticus]
MKSASLLALTSLLSACTSWPEEGGGGMAETFSSDAYLSTPAHLYEQQRQQSRLTDAQLHLDMLKIRGAYHCLPGRLTEAERQMARSRRELAGGLYADAEESLLVLHDQLFRISVRLDTLRRQTQCASPMITAVQGDASKRSAASAWNDATPLMLCNNLFADGQSQLLPEFQAQLSQLAAEMANDPTLHAYVLGHTDSRGSDQSNQALGQARADAVKRHLVVLGVSEDRIHTLSLGERTPLGANSDLTGQLRNRRVEIRLAQRLEGQGAEADSVLMKHWPNAFRGD